MKLILFALACGVICWTGVITIAQKGRFDEIKQLQSPQKPLRGLMIAGVFDGPRTPEREKLVRDRLKQVVAAADAALRRGNLASSVLRRATAALRSAGLSSGGFAVMALDSKGVLASGSTAGAATFSDKMCAAAWLGSVKQKAAEICTDVGQHAMTVQRAVDSQVSKAKDTPAPHAMVMDKFGDMGISSKSAEMYSAYIGPDGIPVVNIYN
jgi:hypothetical protein